MAVVNLEVPEVLLADIYVEVGRVLHHAAEEEELPDERRAAASGVPQGEVVRAEPRPGMVQVTFDIPDHVLGRFYLMVGSKLRLADGRVADEEAAAQLHDWGTGPREADMGPAREVWRKFSPKAQAVFGLLIDNPGVAVTGADIAGKLDIPNGNRGVAGIVAWPARHCADAGRNPLFRYEDADGGYWMDTVTADLFAQVRDAARPRPRQAS